MRTQIHPRRISKPIIPLHSLHDTERDLPATGGATRREPELVAVRDLRGLPDRNSVVAQVVEGHGAVLRLQGLDGGVGDGARVEGGGTVGGDGFEGVGVAFARHGVVEAEEGSVGREVDRPVGVRDEEVRAGGEFDEVRGDAEAVAGEVDGGCQDGGPGEFAVVFVQVFGAAEFAGDAAFFVDVRCWSNVWLGLLKLRI